MQTQANSPALFSPRRKTSLASPFFTPFSLSLSLYPIGPISGKRHKKREDKVREMDGERKGDINITFTKCPFTLELISSEKVKTRLSVLFDSVVSLYPPPVATCLKILYFSALTPISPVVVYAHSVLAFTMHPSFPSPPIYCELAPPNDGAYTCLQD